MVFVFCPTGVLPNDITMRGNDKDSRQKNYFVLIFLRLTSISRFAWILITRGRPVHKATMCRPLVNSFPYWRLFWKTPQIEIMASLMHINSHQKGSTQNPLT